MEKDLQEATRDVKNAAGLKAVLNTDAGDARNTKL